MADQVDAVAGPLVQGVRPGVADALRLQHAQKGPGLRYFIKRGATTWYSVGFRTKREASEWINSHGDALEWRAGFVFRLRGDSRDVDIVNRRGELARA